MSCLCLCSVKAISEVEVRISNVQSSLLANKKSLFHFNLCVLREGGEGQWSVSQKPAVFAVSLLPSHELKGSHSGHHQAGQ